MKLGDKIKKYREENRMTQRDIAEMLEVEPGTVSKYESGMLEPNIESIKRLSETFGITIDELLKEAISRAKEIIEQKNPELENKEEVAKKVGIGAVIFNDLSASRIKDEVFDWDTILNFQGETGPYIQYTYVRTKSILEKAEYLPKIEEVKTEMLTDECSQDILKLIYNFQDILVQVTEKNEPSILARYLIDLAKSYSSFYNGNKIIVEDKKVQNARVYLTYATSEILKQGAKLLGIEMPEKM